MSVSLVDPPQNPFCEATLIRLTDPKFLDHYKQEILHGCLISVFDQTQLDQMHRSTDAMLLAIVKVADQVVESFSNASGGTWNVLQPMLLMDELLPRLLWQITSSSYEVMLLVGGVAANVLQPGGDWQQSIGEGRSLMNLSF